MLKSYRILRLSDLTKKNPTLDIYYQEENKGSSQQEHKILGYFLLYKTITIFVKNGFANTI